MTQSTKGFVHDNKIRADVQWADSNPNMDNDEWASGANHWKVTLKMGRRQLTVPFSTGSALGEPEAVDVLDCLASDASGVENARGFADWAEEYGYDPDSRSAERTYRVTKQQTENLRRFLGQPLFAQLVWDTERL